MQLDMNAAYETTYQGEKAILLKAGRYEAFLLPEIGGNLIAFRDTEKGFHFLHEPLTEEMEAFKAFPVIHGIPVLFPPNRYEDGKFPWQGIVYQFPVNEKETNTHLHGFVHNIPWNVVEYGSTGQTSYGVVSISVNERHPVYACFPHKFTIRIRYELSDLGLSQQVLVRNEGEDQLPCLIAFHTAVHVPFAPESTAGDYSLKLTIGKRWELNERHLPTGRFLPSGEEERLRGEGIPPFQEAMNNHYTVQAQNGRNRMELTDTKQGASLIYDAGTSYKMWMLWNNEAAEDFICAEPQMNLVNAPNVDLPAEEIGLVSLAPGEIWEETARLYLITKEEKR